MRIRTREKEHLARKKQFRCGRSKAEIEETNIKGNPPTRNRRPRPRHFRPGELPQCLLAAIRGSSKREAAGVGRKEKMRRWKKTNGKEDMV